MVYEDVIKKKTIIGYAKYVMQILYKTKLWRNKTHDPHEQERYTANIKLNIPVAIETKMHTNHSKKSTSIWIYYKAKFKRLLCVIKYVFVLI